MGLEVILLLAVILQNLVVLYMLPRGRLMLRLMLLFCMATMDMDLELVPMDTDLELVPTDMDLELVFMELVSMELDMVSMDMVPMDMVPLLSMLVMPVSVLLPPPPLLVLPLLL